MKKPNKAQTTFYLSLFMFLLVLVAATFGDKGVVTVYKFKSELNELKSFNKKLTNENLRLRNEIAALKSDPFAVEKVAREKLNLVKAGEVIYQFVPSSKN